MSEIKVPVFPESVADGTIVAWNFNEGDQVSRDAVSVSYTHLTLPTNREV